LAPDPSPCPQALYPTELDPFGPEKYEKKLIESIEIVEEGLEFPASVQISLNFTFEVGTVIVRILDLLNLL
jgi:hypothetical protein